MTQYTQLKHLKCKQTCIGHGKETEAYALP